MEQLSMTERAENDLRMENNDTYIDNNSINNSKEEEEEEENTRSTNEIEIENPPSKGWELVKRKLLIKVGATLEFRTLRDMYGDVLMDPSAMRFVSKIAEGNFGMVDKYEYTEADGTISYIAVKRLRPGDICAQDMLDFMREVEILKKLRHSRIASFRGTGYLPSNIEGEEESDVFLAQELLTGGTLRDLLERQRMSRDTEFYTLKEALTWLLDVARAVCYLHSAEPQVIHRDLKLENIMLTDEGIAKIVDFGLHKMIDKWEREGAETDDGMFEMTGGTGAYMYMPPEAFLGQRYNHKVDVYSFAIIAWELLHKEMLMYRVSLDGDPQVLRRYAKYVATKEYRPMISSTLPRSIEIKQNLNFIAQLIEEMWVQDPAERPEFEDIIPRLKKLVVELSYVEELKTMSMTETPLVEEAPERCCFIFPISFKFWSS